MTAVAQGLVRTILKQYPAWDNENKNGIRNRNGIRDRNGNETGSKNG